MKENIQHVQLPRMISLSERNLKPTDLVVYLNIKRHVNHKTGEAFPSLRTIAIECGATVNTIRAAITALKNAEFLCTTVKNKKTYYTFPKCTRFEKFSYDFLDCKELSFQEKGYYAAMQEHLFTEELPGIDGGGDNYGKTTYSNLELMEKLNISERTLKRYDRLLSDKGMLEIYKTKVIDKATGLLQELRIFNLDKVQQAAVVCWAVHDVRIDDHDVQFQEVNEKINNLARENEILKHNYELEVEKRKELERKMNRLEIENSKLNGILDINNISID